MQNLSTPTSACQCANCPGTACTCGCQAAPADKQQTPVANTCTCGPNCACKSACLCV